MSVPTQGKQYTIVSGDTLERIATIAYGDSTKWRKLFNANQTTLRSGDPNLIFPGEVINIPIDDIVPATKDVIQGKQKDDFTLVIEDREIPVQSADFVMTMDTAANQWTCPIVWNPGQDKELDELLKPYAYPKCKVYIGGNLKSTGRLYTPENDFNDKQRIKILKCWSSTADIVDSNLKPPYEFKNITLEQVTETLLEPYGLKAIFNDDTGGKFDKMTADKKDTVFTFLKKYASQRSLLISCDEFSNLIFQRANVDGVSVGAIQEDEQNALSYKATFDGRKRFNAYRLIGKTPGGSNTVTTAKDNQIPIPRFKTMDAPDTTKGNIKNAADWVRSKSLSEALTQNFPVDGWYAPNDELWKENTIVSVTSVTLGVPNGFDYLIKRVKFSFKNDGIGADLTLVPPQVYTGEPIDNIFV